MLKWEDLPVEMKSSEVESYYQLVSKRKGSLIFKRCLDWALALVLLILTSPVFLILSIWIKLDSKGPVIYKQERVTQYNLTFQDLEVPYHGDGCRQKRKFGDFC